MSARLESPGLACVIGHPVGHSLSPAMHNAAFRALGLPHQYVAFDVMPERVAEAVAGAAALGFLGMNVTIPHKAAVILALARISGSAATLRWRLRKQYTPGGPGTN